MFHKKIVDTRDWVERDVVQDDKDAARYDMLLALLEDERVKIAATPEAKKEFELRCAGEWLDADDGMADIFSKKVLGEEVSSWHPCRIEEKAAEWDAKFNDYGKWNATHAEAKKDTLQTFGIGIGIAAAAIIGLCSVAFLKFR